MQSFAAEDAGSVGVEERRDDDVSRLDGADIAADRLDDADELVSHASAALAHGQRVVGPEVAAADGGGA